MNATMKNARTGAFSIMALISVFLPQITMGMNSTIPQTHKTAKHPHCNRNTVFINAQHRRNRGGICGNTYGNGFDIFSCCNRQFEKSSVALFIIPSSEFFACLPISHTTPPHTVSQGINAFVLVAVGGEDSGQMLDGEVAHHHR